MSRSEWIPHPASFRDPTAFVGEREGVLFRAVHPSGFADLDALTNSGLYDELCRDSLLVDHQDIGAGHLPDLPQWRLLLPRRLTVISYACEWTAGQLKAAALLTLDIQRRALARGLSLKDASAFNVQFVGGKPIFIDTLSFTRSAGDTPWIAYRQFCEHFLGPLALEVHRPDAATLLTHAQIDGIPLTTASRLLPLHTWARLGLLMHLHLHAHTGRKRTPQPAGGRSTAEPQFKRSVGYAAQLAQSLQRTVETLEADTTASHWSGYRQTNTYAERDTQAKIDFVKECAGTVQPARALDLGANDGLYSELLAQLSIPCSAVEADRTCAEQIFKRSHAMTGVSAPLNTFRVDLANPTPPHGWAGTERAGFADRVGCDFVLALALIHHLAISRQMPYVRISQFLAQLGKHLVIEFVPPTDPMAAHLLAAHPGLAAHAHYGRDAFLDAFQRCFIIAREFGPLAGGRILFLMHRRTDLFPHR